jgi:hypothetical protein
MVLMPGLAKPFQESGIPSINSLNDLEGPQNRAGRGTWLVCRHSLASAEVLKHAISTVGGFA